MKDLLSVRVDGELTQSPWPADRGLQYGDGLFETMTARQGRVRFRALHQRRLAEGCRRLGIAPDADALWEEVDACAAATPDATLKLLVTRGSAISRGYAPDGNEKARRVLYVFDGTTTATPSGQVRVIRLGATLGENALLAGLKHTNRLEQVLARAQLHGSGAFEGLMASSTGLLISGTMTNVFLRIRGEWMTPRVDRSGIAGIARAIVLREALREQFPLREVEVPFAALDECEELFLTNVRLGVQPVTHLEERALQTGKWVQSLRQRIASLDE